MNTLDIYPRCINKCHWALTLEFETKNHLHHFLNMSLHRFVKNTMLVINLKASTWSRSMQLINILQHYVLSFLQKKRIVVMDNFLSPYVDNIKNTYDRLTKNDNLSDLWGNYQAELSEKITTAPGTASKLFGNCRFDMPTKYPAR